MRVETILVADDEAAQREVLAGFLAKKGYEVLVAAGTPEALSLFRENAVDFVLTDFRMPGGGGLELLRGVRGINPDVPVVVVTAYGSIDGAVEMMREGAFDYLTKPIKLNALEKVVTRGLRHRMVQSENKLIDSAWPRTSLPGVSAQSDRMQEALNVAARAASSDATVLVLGETGTGKELIARAIHSASGRHEGVFLPVNCAALAEGLLESELFGHERGAFTGAHSKHTGRFEEAAGGTLFLDEIGDVPIGTQVKLLRALQEGTFERVGSSQSLQADARIIAATHRDLEGMVREGGFREDFYYRLNVICIEIPPLRERREDIPGLAESFLKLYAVKNGKALQGISREAMDLLIRYDFPGNVRQLENAIERGVVMSRGTLLAVEDLPSAIASRQTDRPVIPAEGSLPDRLEAIEKAAVLEAMEKAGGVQSQAARLLGINERNMRYKLKKYGLK